MPDPHALSRLGALLDASATPEAKAFWLRLTRGALPARGVPDVLIRTRMHSWWKAEKLPLASPATQRRTALAMLALPHVEEKLAGIHALAEIVLPALDPPALAELGLALAAGCLADPFTQDWLTAKVLVPLAAHARDPGGVTRTLVAWAAAPSPDQRRVAAAALAELAARAPSPAPPSPALLRSRRASGPGRAPRPGSRPRRTGAG